MQTNDPIKQLDAALEMRSVGNSLGALNQFQELERRSAHPRDIATLRLFQTMCLTDLGLIDEAYEEIRRVDKKSLEPVDRVDFEAEYARITRAKGMTNEALDSVERALKISETVKNKRRVEGARGGLLAMRGVLLAESGKCDEAVAILEEVPAGDPWWPEARIHLGDCKIRKRLYQEAIEAYLSITSNPGEVDAVHHMTAIRNIGCAYYYMGDYRKAIEFLTRVEHSYEDNPTLKSDLFGLLASAHAHLGMTEDVAKYSRESKGTNSLQ